MCTRNSYSPFTLLANEDGDLVQGIIYIWNFINQFKSELSLIDSSFKSLMVNIYFEHIEKDDWITTQLYKYIIPQLYHSLGLYWLERINIPITLTTTPSLISLILEKEGSPFCLSATKYLKQGYLPHMIQPRAKVSILVKLIQLFFLTKEGNTLVSNKMDTQVIGVDGLYRYFIKVNGYLIVETNELNWMIVDTSLKIENLINFYARSKVLREKELSEHIKLIKSDIIVGQKVYQEFGIVNSMIQVNQCTPSDYKIYQERTINPTNEIVKRKEIVNNLIKGVIEFLNVISNDINKKRTNKIKGGSFIVNIINGLNTVYNENMSNLESILNAVHSVLIKTLNKLPICYQDQIYYKKMISFINSEGLGQANISAIQILYYFIQRMVDMKHVKIRINQSSYDEISFSDDEISQDSSETSEELSNVVYSEDDEEKKEKSLKTEVNKQQQKTKEKKKEEKVVKAVIKDNEPSEDSSDGPSEGSSDKSSSQNSSGGSKTKKMEEDSSSESETDESESGNEETDDTLNESDPELKHRLRRRKKKFNLSSFDSDEDNVTLLERIKKEKMKLREKQGSTTSTESDE